MTFCFEPVTAADFDAMAVLRVAAMRKSVENLGRFDAERARVRLRAGFAPEFMRHICANGRRIGCMIEIECRWALHAQVGVTP